MTINKHNTYPEIRLRLIVLISCVLLWIGFNAKLYAQESKNDISVSFVKNTDSLKLSDLYFNVLKISNHTEKAISGDVTFSGPEGWKIIAFPSSQSTINPGDTLWIPVRVSPATNAIGGISYIVTGTFKTSTTQTSTNTYISLPTTVKWDFSINKNSIFFTEENPNTTFQVHLSNKGNTNELIKLHMELGKLLMFTQTSTNENTEYIQLPAYKDTVISYSISYQKKLSYIEKIRFEQNWKESALRASASSESGSRSAVVMFQKLNSTFVNQRAQNSSPLNIDYQLNNLMSNQEPRSNLRVFGSVLFAGNKEIQYIAGVNNMGHSAQQLENFDIDQQLLYSIRYTDQRNNIELSYNTYGGGLHAINGRGIGGSSKIGSKSKISYTATQNPFSNNIGVHAGFSSSIGKVTLNTDVIHENNLNGNYSATSVSAGAGFRFFKNHYLGLQLLGSQANYFQPQRDTTLYGFSYRVNYSVRYKKFELRANGLSSAHNYIRNSGMQQYYLNSKYTLTDKVLFTLYGNRQHYSTTRYPYNLDNPVNYNSTDYLRLTTTISEGVVNYQFGPDYNGSVRQLYNTSTNYTSEYKTYQPGLWGAVNIKLGENRVITPNATLSNLRFYYTTQDPTIPGYALTNNIYYSVGVNYFDNVWRFNAYYTSGSATDLYRSVQIDADPVTTRSIQFRPSYENYFFNQRVKLSVYMNYAYYMPSERENISYSIRYDHFLNKGWSFSLNGYIYSNSRNDREMGRISTKDLNFIVGFRKSFNIQQPRLKYYNFKTVFFNDLDGNRIQSENEPPVSNVLVKIEKDRNASTLQSFIPETELISDVNGKISIENLPKDNYKLSFNPLVNLKSLYFVNGSEQTYFNDKDRTLYIPLAESYKIKGKIILIRDINSSEGKIDLSGIRITATGQKGETFSVLTDNFGTYILSVPNADKYTVRLNNVLGQHFALDTDEVEVQFAQSKTVNLDFTFIEKQRGVQFDGEEIFKFSSFNGQTEESGAAEKKPTKTEVNNEVVSVKPSTYSIQLDALKTYRDPAFYKTKYNLKEDVLYTESNGEYKYYTGSYTTIDRAKADITRLKLPGFPVAINKLELKKATPTAKATPTTSVATQKTIPGTQPIVAPSQSQGIENKIEIKDQAIAKPSEIYSIQLDALKTYRDPSYYNLKFDLKQEVLYTESEEGYKYFTGDYASIDAARTDLVRQGITGYPVVVERALLKKALPTTRQQIYSVQLDALRNYRNPTYYQEKYKLKDEVLYLDKDGEYRYFTGRYKTVEEARADISRLKLVGFPVAIDPDLLKKAMPLDKEQTYSIQLEVSDVYIEPKAVQEKYKLPNEVLYYLDDKGYFRYFTGFFNSLEEAVAEIARLNLKSAIPVAVERLLLKKGNPFEKSQIFTIQLDVLTSYRDPSYYKEKYKLRSNVMFFEKDGEFRYVFGTYNTLEDAKKDQAKLGLNDGFPVLAEKTALKSKK